MVAAKQAKRDLAYLTNRDCRDRNVNMCVVWPSQDENKILSRKISVCIRSLLIAAIPKVYKFGLVVMIFQCTSIWWTRKGSNIHNNDVCESALWCTTSTRSNVNSRAISVYVQSQAKVWGLWHQQKIKVSSGAVPRPGIGLLHCIHQTRTCRLALLILPFISARMSRLQ